MAAKSYLPVATLIVASLVILCGNVEADKKLSHPAFTGSAEFTLKVLYW